jgi:hypothetical protein
VPYTYAKMLAEPGRTAWVNSAVSTLVNTRYAIIAVQHFGFRPSAPPEREAGSGPRPYVAIAACAWYADLGAWTKPFFLLDENVLKLSCTRFG